MGGCRHQDAQGDERRMRGYDSRKRWAHLVSFESLETIVTQKCDGLMTGGSGACQQYQNAARILSEQTGRSAVAASAVL